MKSPSEEQLERWMRKIRNFNSRSVLNTNSSNPLVKYPLIKLEDPEDEEPVIKPKGSIYTSLDIYKS